MTVSPAETLHEIANLKLTCDETATGGTYNGKHVATLQQQLCVVASGHYTHAPRILEAMSPS